MIEVSDAVREWAVTLFIAAILPVLGTVILALLVDVLAKVRGRLQSAQSRELVDDVIASIQQYGDSQNWSGAHKKKVAVAKLEQEGLPANDMTIESAVRRLRIAEGTAKVVASELKPGRRAPRP